MRKGQTVDGSDRRLGQRGGDLGKVHAAAQLTAGDSSKAENHHRGRAEQATTAWSSAGLWLATFPFRRGRKHRATCGRRLPPSPRAVIRGISGLHLGAELFLVSRGDRPGAGARQPHPYPPMTNPPEKLRLREKISYGFGDFASCLYWKTISDFLALFYTDVFGLSATAAGAMLGFSRSFDAVFDVVIGMLADRTNSRWGKFRPYLLYTCIPMAVFGLLTFTTPDFSAKGKLIWAYLTFNAMMLIYTTINIPYTAMLGVITPVPAERTALSSIKFVGAFAGGIVIAATLQSMVKVNGWLGATSVKQGYEMAFVIIGVVAIISFLIVFLNTRERVLPPRAQKTSVGRDLADLFTNRPWLVLLATTITFIFFVALRGTVEAHYFKYYIGTQTITLPSFLPAKIAGTQKWEWESVVSAFKTSNQALSLVGALLVPFFARRMGNKPTFVLLLVIAILSTAAFYLLKPDQLGLIFLINAIGSITGGPLSALLASMYADTADYSEWKNGRRATGLIFSASIFAQKFGWGWGGGLALLLLGGAGFVANQDQTAEALHGMLNLMSIYPAVFGVLALLILVIFYPLNEAKMAQISADLKARRAASGDTPVASNSN
jgi:GPH family glycoside/pentoside/hexuronide:cation symporter